MKLRLRRNSIRLRLLKGEVAQLAASGSVSESIVFPGGSAFAYSLESSRDIEDIRAALGGSGLSVSVPASTVADWAGSDSVAIERSIPCPGGESLTVLIEKDFACIDRKDDPDNADAFPNPGASC